MAECTGTAFNNVKFVLFICLFAGGLGLVAAEPPLELSGDDVIVFLGGTDIVRAQRSGHLETLLTWRFKNEPPTVSYTHLRAPRDRTRSRMPSSA